ncbi:MAG: hypothetical protein CL823_01505 [Crocinitomicaceae bacterium]|nr:hypothetical protein [Crocinitomicaceae bacterium]
MRKLIAILFVFCAIATPFFAQKQSLTAPQGTTVPGELIIMFHGDLNPQLFADKYKNVEGHKTSLEPVKVLSDLSHIYLFRYSEERADGDVLLRELSKDRAVEAVQYNHYVEDRATPNDPSFSQQWHHIQSGDHDIDSDLAWDITTGGETANGDQIVVAVLEGGGSNWDHTDLIANHWVNNGEIPGNGQDDDGNGYTDDYNGWNTNSNNDVISAGGHGTAVSGMIGAKGNNNQGGAGVNWNVGIMQIQMGGLTESNVIAAYNYPYVMRDMFNNSGGSEGAFVVATNASWGIDLANPASYPVWCSYYDDLGEVGIINCGATANAQYNVDTQGDMPTGCGSDYMMSVTATNSNDVRTFSAYGATTIDLAAPGESVYLPSGSSNYSSTSGTSFATPCVAGAIALVYSVPCSDLANAAISNPQNTADIVRGYILDGVDVVPNLVGETVTGGRLNAYNSVSIAMSNCNSDLGCTDPSACNYSPEAIEDNGSCDYFDDCGICGGNNSSCTGCTDSSACNYNTAATIEDGSCVYGNSVSIYVGGGTWDGEITWTLMLNGNTLVSGETGTQELCLGEGCYTLLMYDSYGDGWNGASYSFVDLQSGDIIAMGDLDSAMSGDGTSSGEDLISISGVDCGMGCTDSSACNYDSNAAFDDGSCIYDCIGCTDMSACNFDDFATIDDGSCEYFDQCGECGGDGTGCIGCTDSAACNFDPTATIDDGSCIIGGSGVEINIYTDNYPTETSWQVSSLVEIVASSSQYTESYTNYANQLCLEDGCYTFTISDTFGDGICCAYGEGYYEIVVSGVVVATGGEFFSNESVMFCVGDTEMGCTDSSACNYNPDATMDDGSCDYDCTGCTDEDACNYDVTAIIDDGSCEFPDIAFGCDCESLVEFNTVLVGTDQSEPIEFEGTGMLESIVIDMNWEDVESSASWPADLIILFTSPNGLCYELGGYNVQSGVCDFLGNYLDFYPNEWQTTVAGNYGIEINMIALGIEGEGTWSVSIANGYTNSEGALYDLSIIFVGICEQEITIDILGCTDEEACNYMPEATQDDGSCVFQETPYDCDGNCLNDVNANGICDELDVVGCTDLDACNYNAEATFDDESCEYDSCDCPADINEDGIISVADILLLLGEFGCMSNCDADLNSDGATNVQDVLLLLASFGQSC